MSERRYVERPIKEICDIIPENHTFTKSYIKEHEGTYPVYSATVGKPFGYMSTYTQDEPMLIVVNYGDSGTIYYVDDPFYSLGRNACGLRIKKEYIKHISLEYIKYVAEDKWKQLAKGEGGVKNLNQTMIKNTIIQLPIYQNEYDFEYQSQIVEYYKQVELQKEQLLARIDEIKELSVRIVNDNYSWKKVLCKDLFIPDNGNSDYTKEYLKSHHGIIPLYSGNTYGEYGWIDTADYSGEYLTWAKDGLAGYIMYHNGEFSITGHRGILIPNPSFNNWELINLKYIAYVLEPIFRASIKGRRGDKGKNEYTTLNKAMIMNITEPIPIPIDEKGNYDLEKQKQLVQKYDQIEEIKKQLIDKITELTNIVVS